MPAQATQLVGSNYYHFTGNWEFTNGSHPGMWNAPKVALAPRAGIAFRIDDRTVLRAGYARYVIPTEFNFTAAPIAGFEDINFLEPPFFGMTGYQQVAPLLQWRPAIDFVESFSPSNPLLPNFGPIAGKASGTNVGRGGGKPSLVPAEFPKGL